MQWDELSGSLDFATLRALYASRKARPRDVVRAVYRRIAARGDDRVWIHLAPEDEAMAAASRVESGHDPSSPATTPTIYRIAEVEAEPIALNARLGTYTNFVNLMRLCGVATPAGFRSDGLPLGITILAQPFQEAKAAAIATAHHRALDTTMGATRHRVPPIGSRMMQA